MKAKLLKKLRRKYWDKYEVIQYGSFYKINNNTIWRPYTRLYPNKEAVQKAIYELVSIDVLSEIKMLRRKTGFRLEYPF